MRLYKRMADGKLYTIEGEEAQEIFTGEIRVAKLKADGSYSGYVQKFGGRDDES